MSPEDEEKYRLEVRKELEKKNDEKIKLRIKKEEETKAQGGLIIVAARKLWQLALGK